MRRRLPPTGALEAFLSAARGGTLKAASEDLNLSVSALSRRIQSLETHVGRPLFERRHHELRLTETGERLLRGIEPAFDSLARLLDDLREEKQFRLAVGVPPSFAGAWLLPRLHRFRAAHPDVDIHFDSSGSPLARLGNSLDGIILFAEEPDPSLDMRELKPQSAFAVAAPGLVPDGLSPAEALKTQPLLLHSGLPHIVTSWQKAMGLDRLETRRVDQYNHGPVMIAAAEAGLGIALVLEDMVAFYPGQPRLVPLFGERVATPYSYYWATKPSASASRALRWFRDWLFAEAAADSASGSPLAGA